MHIVGFEVADVEIVIALLWLLDRRLAVAAENLDKGLAERGPALAVPAHAGHARLGVVELLCSLEHLIGRLGRLHAVLIENVLAVGEDFRLRLDREAQLHAALLRAFPRRLLEVARIVVVFLDERGEIREDVFVLAELRQIDGD